MKKQTNTNVIRRVNTSDWNQRQVQPVSSELMVTSYVAGRRPGVPEHRRDDWLDRVVRVVGAAGGA